MNKIKQARLATGISMRQIAARLLVPYRTWQEWESERRHPPKWAELLLLDRLKKIQKTAKSSKTPPSDKG